MLLVSLYFWAFSMIQPYLHHVKGISADDHCIGVLHCPMEHSLLTIMFLCYSLIIFSSFISKVVSHNEYSLMNHLFAIFKLIPFSAKFYYSWDLFRSTAYLSTAFYWFILPCHGSVNFLSRYWIFTSYSNNTEVFLQGLKTNSILFKQSLFPVSLW